MNLQELYKLARRVGAPVVRIGAYHKKLSGNEAERADLIDDDDFGLANELQMCVGARVLLNRNLWPEAGLMNGALGYVRGYVWPRGGDPNSTDSRKRAPLCVVVEFDDVDLKGEMVHDAQAKELGRLHGRELVRRLQAVLSTCGGTPSVGCVASTEDGKGTSFSGISCTADDAAVLTAAVREYMRDQSIAHCISWRSKSSLCWCAARPAPSGRTSPNALPSCWRRLKISTSAFGSRARTAAAVPLPFARRPSGLDGAPT